MSETKTYVFPESGGNGGGSGMLAMLAPLLQQKGIDPNLLVAMQGKNNNGFGGDGSWFMWIIFLFFLFPLMGRGGWGNGFGGNDGGVPANAGLAGLINNDNGRELLMQAITGNGQAINNLATNLNCSVGQIQQAINGVSSKVAEVGCQVGMSSQQIINSIQAGNCQIASQMASCCCDIKTAIQQQGYENQLATLNQTTTLTNQSNSQFNILGAKIDAQTQIINDKFCQLEMREMQNKIDTLRSEKAALEAAALTQAQTANIINQLKPCPSPAYFVPNPNCCYGNPTVVFNEGAGYNNGCGC